MNQFDIRKAIIEAMQKEACNGIWMTFPTDGSIILCTRDAVVDGHFIGRCVGFVAAWKSFGDVTIEPYAEEGMEDDGSYIRVTITPRTTQSHPS